MSAPEPKDPAWQGSGKACGELANPGEDRPNTDASGEREQEVERVGEEDASARRVWPRRPMYPSRLAKQYDLTILIDAGI